MISYFPYFVSDFDQILTLLIENFYPFYWINLKPLFNIVVDRLKKF